MIGYATHAEALAASTTAPPAVYQLDDGSHAAVVHDRRYPRVAALPDGRRVAVAYTGTSHDDPPVWRVVCGADEPDVRCEGLVVNCSNQAMRVIGYPSGHRAALCDVCGSFPSDACIVTPLLRDPFIASIVCASIHGALIGPAADLLAQWLAGDEAARGPLEDLAHELEVLDGRGAWPVVTWSRVDKHGADGNPHVWLPCINADVPGSRFRTWMGEPLSRCTCGMFKHEQIIDDVAAAKRGDAAARDLLGDIPDQCTEPGCTFDDGHAGPCSYESAIDLHALRVGLAASSTVDTDIVQRYIDDDPDVHL